MPVPVAKMANGVAVFPAPRPVTVNWSTSPPSKFTSTRTESVCGPIGTFCGPLPLCSNSGATAPGGCTAVPASASPGASAPGASDATGASDCPGGTDRGAATTDPAVKSAVTPTITTTPPSIRAIGGTIRVARRGRPEIRPSGGRQRRSARKPKRSRVARTRSGSMSPNRIVSSAAPAARISPVGSMMRLSPAYASPPPVPTRLHPTT